MRRWIIAGAVLAVMAGCTHTASYHPVIDKSSFSANVTNPWLPLTPGTTFIYRGTKDGKSTRDEYAVTNRTKMIDGVPTRVVQDKLFMNGKIEEMTLDYYTQDAKGNVWYFGEDTAELDPSGHVKTIEGTWKSGKDGAQPGIFMDADPKIGDAHRQEYYKGHAEDRYKIVSLSASINVPYANYTNALETEETTVLEPDVVDAKFYVKGVGEVEERSKKGPFEEDSLVEIKRTT